MISTSTHRLPWHDTEVCAEPGCEGPITPMHHDTPATAFDVNHVFCAACGRDYQEVDPRKLARIWWSWGAWEGHQVTERAATARGESGGEKANG